MRDQQINVRLTAAEMRMLESLATGWSMSISEAARRAIQFAAGMSRPRVVHEPSNRRGPMKKVISGKTYDTTTATCICALSRFEDDPRNFGHESTTLYKSPRGQFFLAGEGGPRSRWARHEGSESQSGAGMELLDEAEARDFAEQAGAKASTIEAHFAIEVG